MNTNTEREELARTVAIALCDVAGIYETSEQEDREIADAILAAGYSKPRTITTAEELDALPNGSAVLDGSCDVGQKLSGLWHFPETAPIKSSKVAKYGAATVLYTPEATR